MVGDFLTHCRRKCCAVYSAQIHQYCESNLVRVYFSMWHAALACWSWPSCGSIISSFQILFLPSTFNLLSSIAFHQCYSTLQLKCCSFRSIPTVYFLLKLSFILAFPILLLKLFLSQHFFISLSHNLPSSVNLCSESVSSATYPKWGTRNNHWDDLECFLHTPSKVDHLCFNPIQTDPAELPVWNTNSEAMRSHTDPLHSMGGLEQGPRISNTMPNDDDELSHTK